MKRWFLGIFAILAIACRPQIGDTCVLDSECSPDGRELRDCDTRSPGGYCTVQNCNTDECSEEAACVSFRDGDFSFCMLACSTDAECRTDDGYACITPDPALGTAFLDTVAPVGYCGIPGL